MHLEDLSTPALVVGSAAFAHNVATMAAARPGPQLRPHVKAFKSTALATELVEAGHPGFCCATLREVRGMVAAGLGHDLLLANETVDGGRLQATMAEAATMGARVTVAVDSAETIEVAAANGAREALIDVGVGMPRCGCPPEAAGALADMARARGLEVRGVMGYEGHLMMAAPGEKAEKVEAAMALLLAAHADVGGEVVSGGGTGTYAVNRWCTEIQAGSYTLMDTQYASSGDLPFRQALHLLLTVISVNRSGGWAVLDGGLKALGMDHGNPTVLDGDVWFVSDEHITYAPTAGHPLPAVGDRVLAVPAHVDPTVANHERMHVIDGDDVVDTWEIDLRGW